ATGQLETGGARGRGKAVQATAEHREPCDSRGSCTVLGAPGGEIPPGDSTTAVHPGTCGNRQQREDCCRSRLAPPVIPTGFDQSNVVRRGRMRLTSRISLLAIGLASLLGPGAASAGALVEFPILPGHTPANLSGYLARPDAGLSAELGDLSNVGAPFPAVVV